MTILNLTQHTSTSDQHSEGVFDVKDKEALKELLNFVGLPTKKLLQDRADALVKVCEYNGATKAMIGGMPAFMPVLQETLLRNGIEVYYAFSDRVSVEEEVNGQIIKKSVFKHLGLYQA